MFTKENY